ncbi:hypothetical protein CL635_01125 [bacterium]|jgi:hypothetical protein|nr:hypothetical protein [bacterium]|tara:strand:- start:428 stop:625 length:198 start_codon:yes stop_codon:yes gene_type:complete
MSDLIEEALKVVAQIKQMEQEGKPREHIELVAQQARQRLHSLTLMPPMHPDILEFCEVLEKYCVR